MIKKLFAGSTLLVILSGLGTEAYGMIKRNRNRIETINIYYHEVRVRQLNNGEMLKEMRQDIKTILRDMPRKEK